MGGGSCQLDRSESSSFSRENFAIKSHDVCYQTQMCNFQRRKSGSIVAITEMSPVGRGTCSRARHSPRTLRSHSSRAVLGKDRLLDSPATEIKVLVRIRAGKSQRLNTCTTRNSDSSMFPRDFEFRRKLRIVRSGPQRYRMLREFLSLKLIQSQYSSQSDLILKIVPSSFLGSLWSIKRTVST